MKYEVKGYIRYTQIPAYVRIENSLRGTKRNILFSLL